MKLYKKSVEFFQRFDKKYPYKKDDLGVKFLRNNIQIKLWQPFAQEIDLLVYDKEDTKKVVEIIPMTKVRYTWVVNIDLSFEGFYYQFKITQSNGDVNLALDPYVISLAPFNWKGQENGVGKGALVNIKSKEAGPKPRQLKSNLNNSVDPYIYELHIRDFTSGLEQDRFKSRLGTFDAAIDHKIFDYLKELNITHLQLLPIQSAYTVNEFDLGIYSKGHGRGWTTNYNWGYDPHNYFSINGIYSSDPQNPYARIKEFRNFISKAHQKGIAVIIDVVYNHMMTNTILNNVLPGYYYRNLAKQFPVNYPPLADERYMVRKLMIDSLKYFVKEFRVDGFRFDLSCFHHFETIDEIAKELREINPNIILHGEAWPFSDLEHSKSYIKGVRGNNINFGYFNDTLRDAIKGSEHEGYFKGLIHEFSEESFKKYVSSIVGNIKDYDFKGVSHANDTYSLFADNIGMNLAYSACHDGMTLWDKLNILLHNKTLSERINRYCQGLMMSVLTQGRQFMLAGTELLQSKPCDMSGEEGWKCQTTEYDDFEEQPDNSAFHPNSYKTTDYVNSVKWNHLKYESAKYVMKFMKKLNKFRNTTEYFRLDTNEKIKNQLHFTKVDIEKQIIEFKISNSDNTKEVVVIHNFSDNDHFFNTEGEIILSSYRYQRKESSIVYAHSSILLERDIK